MSKVLVMLVCLGAVFCQRARFDNYSVYRVRPDSQAQLDTLKAMQRQSDGVRFLREPHRVGGDVDIMVPPHKKPDFHQFMSRFSMDTRLMVENLQQNIDRENPLIRQYPDFGWKAYYRLDKIYSWLDSLVSKYPQVSALTGGYSYEGRKIRGVRISHKAGNPGVFIESGIHAREWIAPATVTFILNELLTSQDPSVRDVAENYDWYIFPTVNPDGYEYSHTADRMWRGTRSNHGFPCLGVDPNRNWDFHWMENGGATANPCDETYAGPAPFSEVETKTLSRFFRSVADKIDVYFSVHSASQTLMLPYGYTTEHVPDYDRMLAIARRAVWRLAQRYGTRYDVGNIAELLYTASGTSGDWVRGTFNTTFVYSYELRDKGRHGFLLPANQIIPSGLETLDSMVSILEDARVFVRHG